GTGALRQARSRGGSRRTPALAVPDGRARVQVARGLQRLAEGTRPSGGAAGDRPGLAAAPGLPHRLLPPGRTRAHRCPAPRAADLCRLRRLPAAQPAAAPGAHAAGGVRRIRRAPDGYARAPLRGPQCCLMLRCSTATVRAVARIACPALEERTP